MQASTPSPAPELIEAVDASSPANQTLPELGARDEPSNNTTSLAPLGGDDLALATPVDSSLAPTAPTPSSNDTWPSPSTPAPTASPSPAASYGTAPPAPATSSSPPAKVQPPAEVKESSVASSQPPRLMGASLGAAAPQPGGLGTLQDFVATLVVGWQKAEFNQDLM